jgi:hypothetical protein
VNRAWTDAAVLVAIAAAVYGRYVLQGGFAWDDWEKAATTRFHFQSSHLGPFDLREVAYEPGLGILLALAHLVCGTHPAWHLALAAGMAAAFSVVVAQCLREIGLSAEAALAAAVLTLVFPWSDSVRLWATAGLNQVAACLYVIGLTMGLRELRAPSRRRRSTALYAASVLTYPAAILLVLVTPLVYRSASGWRRAWRHGRLDVGVGTVLALYGAIATPKPTQPIADEAAHSATILRELGELLARAIIPVPGLPVGIAVALVVIVLATAAASNACRPWQRRFAAAVLFAIVAYLTYGPGEDKYSPLAPGIYNRVGLLAAPAVAAAVVAFWVVVAHLVHVLARRRWPLTMVALIALLAVGGLWTHRVADDAKSWRQAALQSRSVLSRLDALLPRGIGGSTVFVTGFRRYERPGIPIFSSSFDLDGAFKLLRGTARITTYPVPSRLACARRTVAPVGEPYVRRERAHYRALYFVDVGRGHVWRIAGRRACERALAGMPPASTRWRAGPLRTRSRARSRTPAPSRGAAAGRRPSPASSR